ncbi:hypothetical protein RHMOL_Rhmol01G0110100 [Rhododendron molle]|uniref:Uncharacterized protein n=1 Tax=Rhododendron molle TaxID=49168 RepID=A0ACC0Q0F7_RHOML|nr:hypothetical protein RHMOL_Rhmol01G0110100 [Rhododendron molle]
MKEVDEKAYQAGYDRAGLEYVREARSMVNDAIELRVPIAYRAGNKAGMKAVSEAMQLDLDLSSILAPVVPELELPYNAEECEPLPPQSSQKVMMTLKTSPRPKL